MNVTDKFCHNLANTSFNDLPHDVVEAAKNCVLDALGVVIAGSSLGRGCQEVVNLVKEMGGKEEATIIAYGGKVPCLLAGFANASMGHHLDYDDTHDAGAVHPGLPTVCAGFAMSERVGKVSGAEFITAIVLGIDLICRLGLAVTQRSSGWKDDWLLAAVMGTFGAAGTCGKILGMNEADLTSTLGIACQLASGTTGMIHDPHSEIRGMYPGFAAKSGILATLLAERGIRGPRDAIDGKYGLLGVYFGGEYDKTSLINGLGKEFEILNVSFKPWPCCRYAHSYVEALLGIMEEQAIPCDEIAEVTVSVNEWLRDLMCEPAETKRAPKTIMDARISLPFCLATAIAQKQVTLADFTLNKLTDQGVADFAKKVTYRMDTKVTGQFGVSAGTVELRTKDGKVFSKEIKYAYGHPKNPMSRESLINKFRDCATYCVRPLPSGNVERVTEMVMQLEKVEEVGQIIRLLE